MPSYVLEEAHWAPGSTVTWYYEGTSSAVFSRQLSAGYGTPDLFPAEIRDAFGRWDDFGSIRFQEVSFAAAASIVIGWAGIDGPSNILAQTSYYYYPSTGLFAPPVQITLDSSELYDPSSGHERFGSSASFYAVALHEIGHAIGIAHYTAGPAIMNPYISTINDLTASDIAAVQALYGPSTHPNEIPWGFNWELSAVGDFNSDGTTDIIWQGSDGTLGGWMMANDARAGTLQLPFFPGWTAVGNGDFNGDGIDDVLWQSDSGYVGEWFMGAGTRQATMAIQNMPGWRVIATGDFDGDGTTDIVWDNREGVLGSWLMHSGQIAGTLQLPYFPGWNLVATGDFTGDGIDDFLWEGTGGVVGEWIMGGGTRAATLALGNMAGWISLGSGDFNNDGYDDVLLRDAAGSTQVWLMRDGLIQQAVYEGNSVNFEFVAIGDFNGDGRDDVMWQNRTTQGISFWNMGPGGVVAFAASQAEPADGAGQGELRLEMDSFHFRPPDEGAPNESASGGPFAVADFDGWNLQQQTLQLSGYDLVV